MKSSELTTVLWDGDNTLWDWMAYAVPAYEAMCASIANLAGKSPDETAETMKAFYTEKGSIEDEGLIQWLNTGGFFNGVENFNEAQAIQVAKKVFGAARREHLRIYPEIVPTINRIHELGIEQIVLTDAPIHQARARLRGFGLLSKIEHVYGMPSADVPRRPESNWETAPIPAHYVQRVEKPHTDLEIILKMTREEIARKVAIIGDNKAKDMQLAEIYACLGIHAAYGVSDPELVKRILKFAPERVAHRNMQVTATSLANSTSRIVTANHPSEILRLLGH